MNYLAIYENRGGKKYVKTLKASDDEEAANKAIEYANKKELIFLSVDLIYIIIKDERISEI